MYQGNLATDELAKPIVHGGIEAFFRKRCAVFGEARIDELRVLFLMILFASTYRMRPQRSPNGQ